MTLKKPSIVIHPDEPECVRWVAARVTEDFKAIPEDVLSSVPATIIAGAGDARVQEVLSRYPELSEFEGFVIERIDEKLPLLVVASRHFRGTMFGLLEISRRLGIDPLGYFTDIDHLQVEPCTFETPISSPIPAFRYRGFFIDEEDLLGGWKNPDGPIPLKVFDEIYLTILRLGGNMVIPGSYLSPDSPIIELASNRGLVSAQHHFQIVGTDTGRLTLEQRNMYSFVRHPKETIEVWRQTIRNFKHRETVWTVGYRGTNDGAFWFTEPNPKAFSNRQKGEVISNAIHAQLKLLREELGTHDVPCAYYLYRENQVLFQEGFIKIPEGVSVIWCDNGYGSMETYFRNKYEINGMGEGVPIPDKGEFGQAWPEEKRHADGIYYHVSFYDSAAPNRVQYVSPRKIQDTFLTANEKGLAFYMLLNVGNIREFVLGIAAVFDFARNPKNWLSDHNYHRIFLETWCADRLGKKTAKCAADAYEALYDAHWWWSTSPSKCFGDNVLCELMMDVVNRVLQQENRNWSGSVHIPGLPAGEAFKLLRTEGTDSMHRWIKAVDIAEKLMPHILNGGHTFFYENVLVQAKRGLGAVSTLMKAIKAVDMLSHGNADDVWNIKMNVTDKKGEEACWTALAEAKSALDSWEEALGAADRTPKWKNWSKSDRIVMPELVREYLLAIEHLIKARFIIGRCGLHEHLKRATNCKENNELRK